MRVESKRQRRINHLEKKGYAIMQVVAIVVIWFYLIVAGIMLTMLMPRIA